MGIGGSACWPQRKGSRVEGKRSALNKAEVSPKQLCSTMARTVLRTVEGSHPSKHLVRVEENAVFLWYRRSWHAL
jgi:hypothetical protein